MKDKRRSKTETEMEKKFQKKRRALYRKWCKENPELQRESKRLYRTVKRDMHSQSNTTGYSTDIMRIGQLPCGATIAVQLICDNCDCHSK